MLDQGFAGSEDCVRIAAVGDVLLTGGGGSGASLRDPALFAPEVRSLLASCHLVVGNLEYTLPGDGRYVPTEPRVVAEPEWVDAVAAAGIHVVSLANNHMFDCLAPGFQKLRMRLDQAGLRYFGAGMDLAEAAAPALIETGGLRLAFLGAADRRSGPPHFAASGQFGVAPLDLPRMIEQIGALHGEVDHVVVSLHWGEERFLIPAPEQVEQARALVEAGATMVLGHHPHVLQGLEFWHGRPIVYSLGNFLADDVPYANGDLLRWNRTERTGCVLLAELHPDRVADVRQVPTYDDRRLVGVDHSGFGQRRIERVTRALARGVTLRRYRWEHLWVKTFLPILAHLRWSQLTRLRPHTICNALRNLLAARHAE
ncbi:MAG: CapA family protein [Thermoguttaceae bacterium]|jgi:poly-gamma-glutamate synthesis protein (capsule biosynthesis protein)|nr:CapA family protein [Thermoguttaceae bacterium]